MRSVSDVHWKRTVLCPEYVPSCKIPFPLYQVFFISVFCLQPVISSAFKHKQVVHRNSGFCLKRNSKSWKPILHCCQLMSICRQLFNILERTYSYFLLKMSPTSNHFKQSILCFIKNQKDFTPNAQNWNPFLEEMPGIHLATGLASLCPWILPVSKGCLELLCLSLSLCYITAPYPCQQNCGGMVVPPPCPTDACCCCPQSNRHQNAI